MHSILESEWLRNGLQGRLHRVFLYSSDLRTATRSVTVALYHGPTNVWNFCLCTAGLAIFIFSAKMFLLQETAASSSNVLRCPGIVAVAVRDSSRRRCKYIVALKTSRLTRDGRAKVRHGLVTDHPRLLLLLWYLERRSRWHWRERWTCYRKRGCSVWSLRRSKLILKYIGGRRCHRWSATSHLRKRVGATGRSGLDRIHIWWRRCNACHLRLQTKERLTAVTLLHISCKLRMQSSGC